MSERDWSTQFDAIREKYEHQPQHLNRRKRIEEADDEDV